MADTKYGKFIRKDSVLVGATGTRIFGTRHQKWAGGDVMSVECIPITEPKLMISQAHQHEFTQVLCFASANPKDPDDFDAEIEITLGEEGEKHIINTPSVVFVEARLHHGPLNFKTINKPVLFVDIALTGDYKRIGETPD
jgi:hypothetical protein